MPKLTVENMKEWNHYCFMPKSELSDAPYTCKWYEHNYGILGYCHLLGVDIYDELRECNLPYPVKENEDEKES